jgi:hypothetical protein
MAGGLMDSVLENSINQGLKSNLKNAMEGAGVRVSSNTGLWQYPEIIRNKMAVNTVNNINMVGGDCINVSYTADGDLLTYEISTSLDTYELKRPKWASDNNQWGKKLSVQDIFTDLFTNILPSIRGVYAGDMTSSDYYGNDITEWNHEMFGVKGWKTGLKQNSRYLRLYLTSQHEPLFICVASNIEDITGGYNVGDSDTVSFVVDDGLGVMTAHVNIITDEQLKSIGVIEDGDEETPEIEIPIEPEEPETDE